MKGIEGTRKRHVQLLKGKLRDEMAPVATSLARIRKRHGVDVFADFSRALDDIECVSTGFPALDDLLTGEADGGVTIPGTGRGVPLGRMIEVFGREGVGKSTLLLHLAKAFQARGMRCAFVDAEHAVDLKYAERIGVDLRMPRFYFHQPSSAEEALDVAMEVIEGKVAQLVLVDSVAALTPEVELEGDMGDGGIGLQARLMSKAMRKMKGMVREEKACVIFSNQERALVGGFSRPGMPPPTTTSGGKALKFYADLRLEMRVVRQIRSGTKVTGTMVKARVVKNKVAPPFRQAFMHLSFGDGFVASYQGDEENAGKESEEKDE